MLRRPDQRKAGRDSARRAQSSPAVRSRSAVVGMFLLLLAVGCSSRLPPAPVVPSGPAPPPTSSSAADGAPRVANPINATRFLVNPCALLMPPELTRFRLPTKGTVRFNRLSGPSCSWYTGFIGDVPGPHAFGVDVSLVTEHKQGLSDVYDQHREFPGKYAYFLPTSVQGYPAVFASEADDRAHGICELVVGVNDHLTFSVVYNAYSAEDPTVRADPCGKASMLADDVLTTMKTT